MRAFFAAFPGSDDGARIRALVREIGGEMDSRGVRWVRVESYHVTLRFLGNISPAQVDVLGVLAREALTQTSPVSAKVSGVSFWPSGRRPRLIVIALDSSGRLEALAERLNAALIEGGFGGPDKPFVAHLTLARLRRRVTLALPQLPRELELTLPRVGLFESTTRQEGAVYRPVFTFDQTGT